MGFQRAVSVVLTDRLSRGAHFSALLWDGGIGTTLELSDGRQLDSESNCTVAVSINPELPSVPTASSMADPGGSPWITFYGWLGPTRIQAYQQAFYETRHLIAADWPKLARLTTYYLNRDWRHFDKALEDLLPSELSVPVENSSVCAG